MKKPKGKGSRHLVSFDPGDRGLTLKQMHMYQTMRDLEDECWRIVDEGAGTVEAVWSEVIKVHPWAALDSVRAVLDRERPGRLDDR